MAIYFLLDRHYLCLLMLTYFCIHDLTSYGVATYLSNPQSPKRSPYDFNFNSCSMTPDVFLCLSNSYLRSTKIIGFTSHLPNSPIPSLLDYVYKFP